jgi:dTDP-4-dehydrorhamnose 3,5-epimerase
MKITDTKIPDVKLIEPKVFGDERGFFMETWNEKAFREAGINATFVQDNHSRSVKNTLRGLHYQIKHPQGKLVRVTRGEVFDVAVDLRANSPTFGQWVGERLSEDNKRMLWVPPEFAHGFLVLSDSADFLYKTTDYYHPESEQALLWNDPDLKIEWPVNELPNGPLLSSKDKIAKVLKEVPLF